MGAGWTAEARHGLPRVLLFSLFTVTAAVGVGRLAGARPTTMLAALDRAELPPTTTTSTTTSTTTTTTTTAPPQAVRAARPVVVPRDPYAREQIRELGTIEIPKIGLVHRTFQGITLNNIDRGPSHWPGTAMPGQVGNTVFAGHRVTHSRPFRNIDQLVPGDLVIFTVGDVRSTYRVTGSQVVTPAAIWIADQTANATGTIYACHPPGSAAYRYVVRMELVDSA